MLFTIAPLNVIQGSIFPSPWANVTEDDRLVGVPRSEEWLGAV